MQVLFDKKSIWLPFRLSESWKGKGVGEGGRDRILRVQGRTVFIMHPEHRVPTPYPHPLSP